MSTILGVAIIYKVIMNLWDRFLDYFFQMKVLHCFDEIFFYDSKDSLSNTSLIHICTKFTNEEMNSYMKNKWKNIP
jgi:hypothetical protein